MQADVAARRVDRKPQRIADDGLAEDVHGAARGTDGLRSGAVEEDVATYRDQRAIDRRGLVVAELQPAAIGADAGAGVLDDAVAGIVTVAPEQQVQLAGVRGKGGAALQRWPRSR
jgi:hypothetical protein